MTQVPAIEDPDVKRAIDKLSSLQAGDLGLVETVACGRKTIPALRHLVFEREPSGLYETRRRAVEALARLGANGVLIDFLEASLAREIRDPVEWTGEEAVINAAARALAEAGDARAVPVLLDVVHQHLAAGVIEALGKFGCIEALPRFIDALADDFTRPAAERALRRMGPRARAALLAAAHLRVPTREHETVSSRRRRRSAVVLLAEIGVPRGEWSSFCELAQDDDPEVAVAACRACLAAGLGTDPQPFVRRLLALIERADTLLGEEIGDCLIERFRISKPLIEAYLNGASAMGATNARTRQLLLRVMARAGVAPAPQLSHVGKPA